jgi:AcrR family transcriptional regulator
MTRPADEPRPRVGLRERKKQQTRAAIREHGMRLFREQGYAATTVEQIAEAADVSPSTFFRYYPTKDEVVLQDDLDEQLLQAMRGQPAELCTIPAVRDAIAAVRASLDEPAWAAESERHRLIIGVPELRARFLDEAARTVRLLAEVAAERSGRPTDDIRVRTVAGAIFGVALAAMFAVAEDPAADEFGLIDAGLALLAEGLGDL